MRSRVGLEATVAVAADGSSAPIVDRPADEGSEQPLRVREAEGLGLAHHGEILQGIFWNRAGSLQRALVTLPWPDSVARARFIPDGSGQVRVKPLDRSKAARAAELIGIEICGRVVGGELSLSGEILLSRGFGSSTADVVASIRAVASALGRSVPATDLARLAVRAEVASDSTMFTERAVLFAQRDGVVLRSFAGTLPRMHVVGVDLSDGGLVETLSLTPTCYQPDEAEAFGVLLGALSRGIVDADIGLVGAVASASARISQKHHPLRGFSDVMAISERFGAAGTQVAHSGTVAGMLFAPETSGSQRAMAMSAVATLGLTPYEFMTS